MYGSNSLFPHPRLYSYIATFQNIDLTKNFYFSYTYDITNTLQVNMTGPPPGMDTLNNEKREAKENDDGDNNNNNNNNDNNDINDEKVHNNNTDQDNKSTNVPVEHNDMFVWNHYLLKSGFKDLNSRSGWILPLIYGFVDQASKLLFFPFI